MNEVYHTTMKNRPDAFVQSVDQEIQVMTFKNRFMYGEDLYHILRHEYLKVVSIQGLIVLNCKELNNRRRISRTYIR